MRNFALFVAAIATTACGVAPNPAALDPRADACTTCRMIVADRHFASQIVAPYEEPRFFDDFGCLQRYLERTELPRGAAIFVADHRTGAWISADAAVYSRSVTGTAPMGSPIMAHVSAASRAADPDAAGGAEIDKDTALGRVKSGGTR